MNLQARFRVLVRVAIACAGSIASGAAAAPIFTEDFSSTAGGSLNARAQFQTAFDLRVFNGYAGWGGGGRFHAVDRDASAAEDWAAMFWITHTITSPSFAANDAGTRYDVHFEAGPGVYAAGSQVTGSAERLVFEVLNGSGTVIHTEVIDPEDWGVGTGPGSLPLEEGSFTYVGDGDSDARLRIRGQLNASRFNGTVDNISVLRFLLPSFTPPPPPPPPPSLASRVRPLAGGSGAGYRENLLAIGAALDEVRGTSSDELADLIEQLDDIQSDRELGQALASLSPVHNEAPGRVILQQTRSLMHRVRFNSLAGLEIGGRDRARHETLTEALATMAPRGATGWEKGEGEAVEEASELPPVSARTGSRGWNAFAEAIGGYGTVDSHRGRAGLRYWTSGLLAGADYAPSETLLVGLTGAYAYSDSQGRGEDVNGSVHSGRLGPHLAFRRGSLVADAGLSFGLHEIDTDRRSLTGTVRGDHDAWDLGFHGEARWDFERGDLRFGPLARLEFIHLDEDGYSESGGEATALKVDSRDTQSLTSTLGGQVSWRPASSEMGLKVDAELGWVHEYLDDAESLGARFSADPVSGFTVRLPGADSNAVEGALRASVALREDLRLEASYEGRRSSHAENHTGSLRVQWRF